MNFGIVKLIMINDEYKILYKWKGTKIISTNLNFNKQNIPKEKEKVDNWEFSDKIAKVFSKYWYFSKKNNS